MKKVVYVIVMHVVLAGSVWLNWSQWLSQRDSTVRQNALINYKVNTEYKDLVSNVSANKNIPRAVKERIKRLVAEAPTCPEVRNTNDFLRPTGLITKFLTKRPTKEVPFGLQVSYIGETAVGIDYQAARFRRVGLNLGMLWAIGPTATLSYRLSTPVSERIELMGGVVYDLREGREAGLIGLRLPF